MQDTVDRINECIADLKLEKSTINKRRVTVEGVSIEKYIGDEVVRSWYLFDLVGTSVCMTCTASFVVSVNIPDANYTRTKPVVSRKIALTKSRMSKSLALFFHEVKLTEDALIRTNRAINERDAAVRKYAAEMAAAVGGKPLKYPGGVSVETLYGDVTLGWSGNESSPAYRITLRLPPEAIIKVVKALQDKSETFTEGWISD